MEDRRRNTRAMSAHREHRETSSVLCVCVCVFVEILAAGIPANKQTKQTAVCGIGLDLEKQFSYFLILNSKIPLLTTMCVCVRYTLSKDKHFMLDWHDSMLPCERLQPTREYSRVGARKWKHG